MAGEATAIAGISAAIWLYLVTLRGGFWRARERLDDGLPAPGDWPRVVALVPARDEAEVIGRAVESLLAQDYPGPLGVVVCDDHSDDGTAAAAQQAAGRSRRPGHLSVVAARPLPAGWSGKLWTLNEALVQAEARWPEADYLLLSDADVAHGPETLRLLVAKAERERRDLVSLMVTLSCHGPWARMLIPPFVYFFQLLYPFAWVNDPARRTAAAAGGCVLLRHDALTRAGGFESIRGELIDDCALARRIKGLGRSEGSAKKVGNIWLGLGVASHSLRPYDGLGDIWRMVARSAYTQLRHAPALLIAALLGLMLTFVAPPLIGLGAVARGHDLAATIGLATWAAMAATAIPIYRLYQQPPWLAACLPLSAALYAAMTLDSARRHWRGHGGVWKGRAGPGRTRTAGPRWHLMRTTCKLSAIGSRNLEVERAPVSGAVETPSGKGAGDENFPVGSWLLPGRLRPHIASYYRFARAIDDIADNPMLAPEDKIARLARFEDAVRGGETEDPALETAHRMRASLAETGITAKHCTDLVAAFKQDAIKLRYADWSELMGYCENSANPVGRYLLDLHGESVSGYPYSDSLCSALQVLNHLQDCRDDRRNLDRVYLPLDWMAAAGVDVADLDRSRSGSDMRALLDRCLDAVEDLVLVARDLPANLRSPRLAMESAVIVRLAERLSLRLRRGDPLAGRVALSRPDFLACGLRGAGGALLHRALGGGRPGQPARQGP